MSRPRKHRCFTLTTPEGIEARVHGDPKMPKQDREALLRLMKAAYDHVVNKKAAP